MKSTAILATVFFLAVQSVPQNTQKAQSEAECKFSGGKRILVTYSLSERVGSTTLRTTEDLATAHGVNIPPGDYAVQPTRGPHDNWLFEIIKLDTGKSLRLPSALLSAKQPSSPVRNFKISFDHTGGNCRMQWDSAQANILFSLEFAAKNADIPVLP